MTELAKRHGRSQPKQAFQGEVVEATLAEEKTLLLCPHTLMNRSGGSVLAARDFYKIEQENLLVVSDDLNLPLGKLRFRASGSSGGQKGLGDVIERLGTQEIARLRIGIGGPPGERDAADWVLGRFTKAEQAEIDVAIMQAADAVEVWAKEGVAKVMNRYN